MLNLKSTAAFADPAFAQNYYLLARSKRVNDHRPFLESNPHKENAGQMPRVRVVKLLRLSFAAASSQAENDRATDQQTNRRRFGNNRHARTEIVDQPHSR